MKIEYTFRNENAAGKLTLVYDRPELMGSEKQIAWAEEIRNKAEIMIINLALNEASEVEGVVLQRDLANTQIIDRLTKLNQLLEIEIPTGKIGDALTKGLSNPSAQWWIEKGRFMQAIDFAR